jgi:hypothetical protein
MREPSTEDIQGSRPLTADSAGPAQESNSVVESPSFPKVTSLRLIGVGFDAGRRVYHRLLADSYEAGIWSVKILDQ